MTFARFMELALYDRDGGYYTGPEARPGRAGDFLTAPEAHPIFGWALARPVHQPGAAPAPPRPLRSQPVEVAPRRITALEQRLRAAGHGSTLDSGGKVQGPVT